MQAGRHARTISLVTVLATTLTASLAGSSSAGYRRPQGSTERVSVMRGSSEPTNREIANRLGPAAASSPSLSADGNVIAFQSDASGVLDKPLSIDVFAHDRRTGRTELVSETRNGLPPIPGCLGSLVGYSYQPQVSPNGRYVAFSSCAGNLVERDLNLTMDVFLRDLRTNRTRLISVRRDGTQGNGSSLHPAFSPDGRYVLFWTLATNLVPKDGQQIISYDLRTKKLRGYGPFRSEGSNVDGAVCPVPSRKVRHIAVEGHLGGSAQLPMVYDVGKKRMEVLVPAAPDALRGLLDRRHGNAPCTSGRGNVLSADGRFAVFATSNRYLVPMDTNPSDTFVRDRKTGRIERVSVTSLGEQSAGATPLNHTTISADGRFITFVSSGNDLGSPEAAGQTDRDVFIHDRITGVTEWVSRSYSGGEANFGMCKSLLGEEIPCTGNGASAPALAPDARTLVFASDFANLVRRDRNETSDVFRTFLGRPRGIGRLDGTVAAAGSSDKARVAAVLDDAGDLPAGALDPEVDLIGARVVSRPWLGDLYLKVDVADMASFLPGAGSSSVEGSVLIGARFEVGDRRFEVRAARADASSDLLAGGAIALYDCTHAAPLCERVTRLRGGYGTVGEGVVASIPMSAVGLSAGGRIDEFQAFTAYGTIAAGALVGLDIASILD